MSKELVALIDSINKKKQEVKDLAAEEKFEEANKVKDELKKLQAKFDLIYDLEVEDDNGKAKAVAAKAKNKGKEKVKDIVKACVNLVKSKLKNEAPTEEDLEAYNALNESVEEEGGVLVPKDVRTQIKELRRSSDALETLVNVENVTTLSGSRVIEKNAEEVPFDNVEEAAEFPDADEPEFTTITYKVKKKGGILKVTRELLEDAAENIMAYLKKWIAKKGKATRNALILKVVNEITKGKEVVLSGIDTLKDIFNEKLDPAIATTSKIVTNQTGYNWLDKLKDADGKYILQPNPMDKTGKLLFGMYEVKVLSNKTLKNEIEGNQVKTPFICGDLKEAITLFQREGITIDINGTAGEYWKKDMYALKVRERLDVQAVDKEAIIKAYVAVEVPTNNGEQKENVQPVADPTTLAELNAMTIPNLKALAAEKNIDLGEATLKNDIVTAIATALNITE